MLSNHSCKKMFVVGKVFLEIGEKMWEITLSFAGKIANFRSNWKVRLEVVNWKSQEVFATNWQHFLHWRQECQDKCGVSFFVWLRDQFVSKRSFKMSQGKFFIMSMEFDKNISDWNHDCTDHKNGIGFFMWLVKWPKIAAKKSQKFQKF